MSERARLWQRVSTGGQDEASQLPDLLKWCDSHGYDYDLAESYIMHGRSAWHGRHAADLDRAFADMAAGLYTVLVVWKQDRIERRGMEAALALISRAKQAGGRIEFAMQPHLNKLNDMGGRISYAIMAEVAQEESRTKSDRVKAKNNALRSAGSFVGRPPFGYAIVKREGRKVLEPTKDGERWIPAIYEAAIGGMSLRDIAAMLDSAGVPAPGGGKRWNEGTVGNTIIPNPVYFGSRRNSGQLETKALVSVSQWRQANASVASRVRPGRGTVKHEKPLVAPFCGECFGEVRPGCNSGKSPMYRTFGKYADGKRALFRCSGHGPQRKGCGAPLLLVSQVEADVLATMAEDMSWHVERVFVPGDDTADRIAALQEKGAEAIRAGDYATAAALMEQAAALDSGPSVAAHWEDRLTDQTEADYFAGLDRDAQRDYLRSREIVATSGGVVIVPRAWTA